MKTLLRLLIAFPIGIGQSLMGGYVLAKLWGWFIVPKFTSAPALTYLDAVGLMMTVGFLLTGVHMAVLERQHARPELEKEWWYTSVKSGVVTVTLYPLVLLAGYIWHQFI